MLTKHRHSDKQTLSVRSWNFHLPLTTLEWPHIQLLYHAVSISRSFKRMVDDPNYPDSTLTYPKCGSAYILIFTPKFNRVLRYDEKWKFLCKSLFFFFTVYLMFHFEMYVCLDCMLVENNIKQNDCSFWRRLWL